MSIGARFIFCLGGALVSVAPVSDRPAPYSDPRAQELAEFFQEYDCPEPLHVTEYLRAADAYDVDYRLLPVISVLESSCGKYQRRNNRWGWNSARTGFQSVASGIDFITQRLTEGPYENDSLDEKLYTYNPYVKYVRTARRLIDKLDEPAQLE